MKVFLTVILILTVIKNAISQIYVDPVTAGATAAHSAIINGQLDKTNEKLTLIERGQLAITGQLVVVNDLQDKIYKGLSQVSSVVKSLVAVRDIAEISVDIIDDGNKALKLAKGNPALLLFAQKGAREFQARSHTVLAEVSSFVLSGGKDNLMDSGERAKLLNRIKQELMILRGVAYGMHRTMFWAKQRGILKSLNPYSRYVNLDRRIADDIVKNAKYLRQ